MCEAARIELQAKFFLPCLERREHFAGIGGRGWRSRALAEALDAVGIQRYLAAQLEQHRGGRGGGALLVARRQCTGVDVEGITAKLENGILIVDVPKLNGEFVEVKKVDIE